MPRTQLIEKTVYRFNELSDSAKETARDWYRTGGLDYDWWDAVCDDFDRVAEILGISVSEKYFSGFWSQGDGACFFGSYRYAKGAARAIRDYAPQDKALHDIADALAEVQKRNFYSLTASISRHYGAGNHCHENTMAVSVDRDGDNYQDPTSDAEDIVEEAMRDLARWHYRQLESEYEYLNSDESVDEAINANEYEFTEDGDTA